MAEYTYSRDVNTEALDDTLRTASFAALFNGVVVDESASPALVTVITTDELDTAEQDELEGIIDAHNPAAPSVGQMIVAAKKFAADLIDRWQRIIMLDGVVQAGQAHEVATALAVSTIHAMHGNLYALDDELGATTPIPTFLDAARLTEIRNEIRTYLGLPLL